MEKIGRILWRSHRNNTDSSVDSSAVLDVVNQTIQQTLQYQPDQARAISFRRDEVIIKTSHGAVSGTIIMNERVIVSAANKKLQQLYGSSAVRITKIITRQT